MHHITVEIYADGLVKPFEPYAWPGSYTLLYYDWYGTVLCAACATTQYEQDTWEDTFHDSIIGCDVYDEGPMLHCEGCGVALESSYGDSPVHEG